MKLESIYYTSYFIATIFTSLFSDFAIQFFALNSEFIIEKVLVVSFSAVFQFVILIPYVKGKIRKAIEIFITEQKVSKQRFEDLEKQVNHISNKQDYQEQNNQKIIMTLLKQNMDTITDKIKV